MLTWMLIGIVIVTAFALKVLHSAESDDKRRKRVVRRAPLSDRYDAS
ncbi:MAG TPA: hypothetical protein VM534_00890 [Thermoanaerobaculia bacterium]|nr:hypothetical protein [Thermoanaerobaculia bacterium]